MEVSGRVAIRAKHQMMGDGQGHAWGAKFVD